MKKIAILLSIFTLNLHLSLPAMEVGKTEKKQEKLDRDKLLTSLQAIFDNDALSMPDRILTTLGTAQSLDENLGLKNTLTDEMMYFIVFSPAFKQAVNKHIARESYIRNIDDLQKVKDSLLFYAAYSNNPALFKLILSLGGNVNAKNFLALPLIEIAIDKSFVEILKILLNHPDISFYPTNDMRTILHIEATDGNTNAIKNILENIEDETIRQDLIMHPGFGINNPEDADYSIHALARQHLIDATKVLLDYGASLLSLKEGIFGDTPLHTAIRNYKTYSTALEKETFISYIKLLLEHGADPSTLNMDNEKPIDLIDDLEMKEQLSKIFNDHSKN